VREGREESAEYVILRRYMAIRHDTSLEHGPFDANTSHDMHDIFSAPFPKKK
jgi:hypothetical protein